MPLPSSMLSLKFSQLLHFDSITTQRVKGAHAVIKKELNAASGLANAMTTIDNYIRYQHDIALHRKEQERFGRDPYLLDDESVGLHEIYGKVSRFAIDNIRVQLSEKKKLDFNQDEQCVCPIHFNFNISCKHLLPNKGAVPLDMIAERWLWMVLKLAESLVEGMLKEMPLPECKSIPEK
ncbi:hypothetical protein BJV82DRAFT_379568 [Fennellomyces sp. T-0311]|nr:hypothetical protein BJV82DRAFT_379568 [Fennellomyces sp. T-0311]